MTSGRQKARIGLCLLGATIVIAIGLRICLQHGDPIDDVSEVSIGTGMGPDLMIRNHELDFRQFEQLIAETIHDGGWIHHNSIPLKPFRTIESVLTNGEGCKTFTYDGDGNLSPEIESGKDASVSGDNPFE